VGPFTITAEPNGLDVTECPGDVTESRTYNVTVDLSTAAVPCFNLAVSNIAIECAGPLFPLDAYFKVRATAP